jgi:hypothetical protein
MAALPSGPSWTPPPTKRILKKNLGVITNETENLKSEIFLKHYAMKFYEGVDV